MRVALTEKEFFDLELRKSNLNIQQLIHGKPGDIIDLYGRQYVIKSDTPSKKTGKSYSSFIGIYYKNDNGKFIEAKYVISKLIYIIIHDLFDIPKTHKIGYINDDNKDYRPENLRLIRYTLTEDQFFNYDFMFQNTDINTIINGNKGDRVQLFDRYHTIQHEKLRDFLSITMFYISDKTGKIIQVKHSLKRILQIYHTKETRIDKNATRIEYKDGDRDNINYNNMKIVPIHVPIEDKDNWDIKYKNTDMNELINAKEGSMIHLYDREYRVYLDNNVHDMCIHPMFINEDRDYSNTKNVKMVLYRLIYELYNKEILTREDHIHHINENHYDHRPENLQKISNYEHGILHYNERGMSMFEKQKVYNLNIGEIYGCMAEASEDNNIDPKYLSVLLSDNSPYKMYYKGLIKLSTYLDYLDNCYNFDNTDLNRDYNQLNLSEEDYYNNKWVDDYLWEPDISE